MGTRSTISFYQYDENHKEKQFYGSIYQQYDGYYSGVGAELQEMLAGKRIINGFSNETTETHFNGIGCLGAWVISQFKTRIGECYLTPENNNQGYDYVVYQIFGDPQIYLKIHGFDGPIEGFDPSRDIYE